MDKTTGSPQTVTDRRQRRDKYQTQQENMKETQRYNPEVVYRNAIFYSILVLTLVSLAR